MERRITVRESMENTNTKWRSLSNAAFRQQLLSLRADCRAATSRNFRKPRFFSPPSPSIVNDDSFGSRLTDGLFIRGSFPPRTPRIHFSRSFSRSIPVILLRLHCTPGERSTCMEIQIGSQISFYFLNLMLMVVTMFSIVLRTRELVKHRKVSKNMRCNHWKCKS